MITRGIVMKGKGDATRLGYPTANVLTEDPLSVASGVWTAWCRIGEETIQSLAIIGMWQEAHGGKSLEIHCLNFSRDLYGQQLEIELIERRRDLISFESREALRSQIEHDMQDASLCFQELSKVSGRL